MINIAGQLHAATGDGILANAGEINDPVLGRQDTLNRALNSEVYGSISFTDTNLGESITATRYSQGDITENETTYLCFITEGSARYYVTAIEAGAYVYNYVESSFIQCGIIADYVTPVRNSEAVVEAVQEVKNALGADVQATAHEKLTALSTALQALATQITTTYPYAKEATIGTAADTASVDTIFGKIANLLSVMSGAVAEIGTDANNVSVQTKLNALLNMLGECTFERNNDGADTWTLVLDRLSSVNNNTLDV